MSCSLNLSSHAVKAQFEYLLHLLVKEHVLISCRSTSNLLCEQLRGKGLVNPKPAPHTVVRWLEFLFAAPLWAAFRAAGC